MGFATNLKAARKAAGLTQQQVADRLCIHRTTYTKYECRNVQPSFEHLYLLSKILHVSVEDLLHCPELETILSDSE